MVYPHWYIQWSVRDCTIYSTIDRFPCWFSGSYVCVCVYISPYVISWAGYTLVCVWGLGWGGFVSWCWHFAGAEILFDMFTGEKALCGSPQHRNRRLYITQAPCGKLQLMLLCSAHTHKLYLFLTLSHTQTFYPEPVFLEMHIFQFQIHTSVVVQTFLSFWTRTVNFRCRKWTQTYSITMVK